MNDLMSASASKGRSICTFRMDRRLYGMEVQFVREVSTHVAVTPVPQAPSIVRGLANLRSTIVLVLDLRPALGLPISDCTSESRLVVLQASVAPQAGLLVDCVGEIVHVAPQQIEAASRLEDEPAHPPDGAGATLVVGVCKLENELLIIIDPSGLIAAAEQAVRGHVTLPESRQLLTH